jgi:hypothetical protein
LPLDFGNRNGWQAAGWVNLSKLVFRGSPVLHSSVTTLHGFVDRWMLPLLSVW